MNIEHIDKVAAMKRRREGLLFLLRFNDYTGVGLTRGAANEVYQPIAQWFDDIKESIIEMADAELRAVERDMKNLGVEFDLTPPR